MNKVLLVIAVCLGAFLGWRWMTPLEPPKMEALPAANAKSEDIETLLKSMDAATDFPPMAAYQAISARPLFFSKRRPPPPYVPTQGGNKKPPPARKTGKLRVQLSAIVRVGNHSYALIKGGKNKGTRRVRKGEDVDGWKVVRIEADRVVLRNGSDTETLLLRNYKPVTPVKQPPKKPANRKARPQQPRANKNRKPGAAPSPGGTQRR